MSAPIQRREPAVARAIEVWPSDRSRDDENSALSGDVAMGEASRRWRSLKPTYVTGPPTRGNLIVWPMILRMCVVLGVAALTAWAWVSVFGAKQTRNEASQTMASQSSTASSSVKLAGMGPAMPPLRDDSAAAMELPRDTEATTIPAAKEVSPSPAASLPATTEPPRSTAMAVLAANDPRPGTTTSLPSEIQPPAKTASISAPQTDSPESINRTAVLDDSQISMLIKRGKDFLTSGDFVSARLLLNRAADAGSAEAALTLGSTFDPFVIKRLGGVAIKPDIDRAQKWYQRAAELGSAAASQQLANLARAR